MARVPDAEIERLRREVAVERLATARGIQLRRHGADLIGLCPFHDDHEPSLVITPAKNLWHCLGACQAGGSAIDWVMRAEGVTFRHAVELLRTDYTPSAAAGAKPPPKASSREKLPRLLEAEAEDAVLLRRVVDYYHATLKQSPEALAYLASRGLQHSELVERFRLGFANRTLGYRLPAKNRKEGAEIRARLVKLGVLRASGHEHLSGSLVIPVMDAQGRVTELYGRKITANLREGTPLHLYLPGPHRGVWNEEALAASREIILCESLIDALTFWCAGLRNVTAAYGVEGVTADHWAAFARHGTERVLIAYDRDEAGERAAEKLAAQLLERGIGVYRIQFPKGMDANEYAQKLQPAAKSLELVIRQALWLGSGRPPSAAQGGSDGAALSERDPSGTARAAELRAGRGAGAPAGAGAGELLDRERGGAGAAAGAVGGDDAGGGAHAPGARGGALAAGAGAPVPGEREPERAESGAVARGAAGRSAGAGGAVGVECDPGSAARDRGLGASVQERDRARAAAPEAASVTREPAPPPEVPAVQAQGEELGLQLGDRSWRVRGLGKNTSLESLRVNVRVARESEEPPGGFHVDTLDLYSARQRAQYIAAAAEELGLEPRVVKKDLGQLLLRLEALQEEQLKKALAPESKAVELTDTEREAALELLRDPQLLGRILADFERCGVVGEQTNKLVGYLAAVSRKLEAPLAVVIQSSSAAGKSALMEAVLAFMPEEERVQYSAMTGQSLFYMSESDLRHKILAIVEEEGAERASYALKLLQSEGQLTIASTGKDPASGRLVTHEYRVEGPVMIFLTTTAIEIDEELLNRCLVLTVDEGREQTRAIHRRQRESQTLEGLLARQDREGILRVHRNAQRLLRPLLVANPLARELTFLDEQTRTRRDHMKYLTLIRTVALLHQYQRAVKTAEHAGQRLQYIEVEAADIEIANRLVDEVLGRTLDELPPQTRRLLERIAQWVSERAKAQGLEREDVRFTRREVREHTGWGHTQLKIHLHRLEELEYLQVHSGGARQRLVYALAAGSLPARCGYDANWPGSEGQWSGSGRGLVGPAPRPEKPSPDRKLRPLVGGNGNAHLDASAGARRTVPATEAEAAAAAEVH